MNIQLAKNRSIADVRNEFANVYPFLRLDFYKKDNGKWGSSVKLAKAGLRREGAIEIADGMTVRELEEKFLQHFGLQVQVARKSGKLWLQTTTSDDWTLKQQNQRGQELSKPIEEINNS